MLINIISFIVLEKPLTGSCQSSYKFNSSLSSKETGREASKLIMEIIDNMCTTVLKAKSPGDPQTVINITKISAILQKVLVSALDDFILGNYLGQFKLPKLGQFQNKTFEDGTVNLQVRTMSPVFATHFLHPMPAYPCYLRPSHLLSSLPSPDKTFLLHLRT